MIHVQICNAAWTGCRGGSRNRNAGLDLAKGVSEKSMILAKSADYGHAKSQKIRSLFDENKPPEALLPPSGGCWEIRKVS